MASTRRVRFIDLDHRSPEWVDAPTYFITICTQERVQNQLCGDSAQGILRSIEIYHERQNWFCDLAVLMPDHAHFLLSFNQPEAYERIVGNWKRWVNRHYGIAWQKNFFEHRLRREENLDQKAQYMINNPVRAGLVAEAGDWPYFWQPPT